MTSRRLTLQATACIFMLLSTLAAVDAHRASAEANPIVPIYGLARQAVIPDLAAYRRWSVSHDTRSKTVAAVISLRQDANLLWLHASRVKPTTQAGVVARVLLLRIARDAATLGALVDPYTQARPARIPNRTFVIMNIAYNDAEANWRSLPIPATAIGG
jgi:hypothetical protein